ncbi:MAG: thermosome subunit alpha [Prosthecobacter sp.]|nr:thermosome subunit alpha [Prosthecobacter sp.]
MAETTSTKSLAIDGKRTVGEAVRENNVAACVAIANIVKTSLGPLGLDKMLVDQAGGITITNDGATILTLLEVEHPAAKVLVNLATLQDEEVGDGTTSVVIVAAELLKRANELIKKKVHPTCVIAGYRMACRDATRFIRKSLSHAVDNLGHDCLVNAAKTSLNSKLIGGHLIDFFAEMAVEAVLRAKVEATSSAEASSSSTGGRASRAKYSINAINILKSHGKSAHESRLIQGYALDCTLSSQQMPRALQNAKIACLDMNLSKVKMQQGVKIVVTDVKQLEPIRARENDIAKERIDIILASGCNVILTSKGIDDLINKYLVNSGIMAVRRVSKEDISHIAKATGATIVTTLSDFEGGETFDAAALGSCEQVATEIVGDNELIVFTGTSKSSTSSILLRGASEQMLDEMARSLHDALCVVKRCLEAGRVVPGGGCIEAALSIKLNELAKATGSRDQMAIAAFADALLVIPKTLATNGALDALEITTRLVAAHHLAQTSDQAQYLTYGLNLEDGDIRDNLRTGVLEPALSKLKTLKFATEAAISILRIDEFIELNPPPAPQLKRGM